MKERLFVTLGMNQKTKNSWNQIFKIFHIFLPLAWLPKATVQAALGPVALDNLYNSGLDPGNDLYKTRYVFSSQILQIAVLVILITAPLGSIAITLSGPKLLKKSDSNNIENTTDNNARNDTQQP